MQVEDEVLLRLEKGGKGKTIYAVGGDTEFIALNFTDPNTEVDGERSSMKTKHPILSDPKVRQALAMLIDRESVKKAIYGRAGRTTANYLNGPEEFVSKNTKWEFSVEKASALLDEAGWKAGSDGIREKDGKKLKLLYQTSINGPRQKTQAIVKQACQKAGIDMTVGAILSEPFIIHNLASSASEREDRVASLLVKVGLKAEHMRAPSLVGSTHIFSCGTIASEKRIRLQSSALLT